MRDNGTGSLVMLAEYKLDRAQRRVRSCSRAQNLDPKKKERYDALRRCSTYAIRGVRPFDVASSALKAQTVLLGSGLEEADRGAVSYQMAIAGQTAAK